MTASRDTLFFSHLQCIRLGKVGHPAHLHGEPHVHHLGSNVTERQVADHHLLHLSGIREADVLDGGQRGPRDLRGETRWESSTTMQCDMRLEHFALLYSWEQKQVLRLFSVS